MFMENFEEIGGDVFNMSPDAFIQPPKKKNLEIYQPSADKGKEGVYKALIRFIPNIRNVQKSKIHKYYVWLDDGTGDAFSVDCPSTVGKKSILKDMYWKLKNSTSVRDQELSDKLSRTESYYSIVQIVRDQNDPELEGKLMIFKFGTKINTKIEKMLKPEFGDPINPYDLFEGKLFALSIVKKQQWNNYDNCEFVGERCPLQIDGKPIERTKEDMDRVRVWLKENSPELEKYEYKEWTDEITEKVVRSLHNIVPDQRLVESIVGAAASGAPSGGMNVSEPMTAQREPEHSVEKRKPASAGAKKDTSTSSLDDLYAGL
jgi:hypothetical protein